MRVFIHSVALFALLISLNAHADSLNVFAAASLSKALGEVAKNYQAEHGVEVKTSFAASSALAKQIENGAPADMFISADLKWMDYLDQQGLLVTASRVNLLGNDLVLIAPKDQTFSAQLELGFDLAAAFDGKLCTGETSAVPVGIYAKEALQNLGVWARLQSRIVGTEDVRAALAFVERGECAAGIVYQTDAQANDKVRVVARFPSASHSPIVYPLALIQDTPTAQAWAAYLHSAPATAVFERYGFRALSP